MYDADTLSFEQWLLDRRESSCAGSKAQFDAVVAQIQGEIDHAAFVKNDILFTFYNEWVNPDGEQSSTGAAQDDLSSFYGGFGDSLDLGSEGGASQAETADESSVPSFE